MDERTEKHASFPVIVSPYLGDKSEWAAFPHGLTIAQALGKDVAETVRVEIGGVEVPRCLWSRVRPRLGTPVNVTLMPAGGNAGKIVRSVAMIVIAIYAPELAPALGYTGAAATAITIGVTVLGAMAVNALIPPPSAKMGSLGGGDPFNQLSSLTGTSNQASPYGVIPCVIGTTRFYPPHAALPYTEIVGEDQYLRMLLDLGHGDLDISNIQIGETDIDVYEDVDYEISTAPTLFTQDIYELQVGAALNAINDTDQRTTQAATTEISLDLIFSQGLFGVDNKGNTTGGQVQFSIQYRPTGGGAWTDISAAAGLSFSGGLELVSGSTIKVYNRKRKTLRCGVRWKVPSGQYDIVIVRGTDNYYGAPAGNTVGGCTWSVLRSINPQNPSSSGTTKLAVRIKATDQLNGVVQNLSVLAAQKIPTYDPGTATWSANAANVNPAWCAAWLMTRCPAVVRRLADTRLDLDEFAAWADECTAKEFTVGFVMDSARALGDVLDDLFACGRASRGMVQGKFAPIRDLEQTVPQQLFTPRNSWGFSFQRSFADLPHALKVTFTNPEANNQPDVMIVYAEGYDHTNATRFESLDLKMMNNPNGAWRMGKYHLAVMRARAGTYTWNADIEHAAADRGAMVHFSHRIISYGLAYGRIVDIAGATVTLDTPVALTAGTSYVMQARNSSNGSDQQDISSWGAGDETNTVTLAAAIDAQVGDLFVIGEANKVTLPMVIKSKRPNADMSAQITAVAYSQAVIDADSGAPPVFVSQITGKAWCSAPKAPVVTIRAGATAPDDAGVIKAQTGVGGSPQGGIYRFRVAGNGGNNPRLIARDPTASGRGY